MLQLIGIPLAETCSGHQFKWWEVMASVSYHYHHNNASNTAACLKRIELYTCKITIMGSSSLIYTGGSMTKDYWKSFHFSTASQPDKWVNLVNEPMGNRPSQWVAINDLSTVDVHKARLVWRSLPIKVSPLEERPKLTANRNLSGFAKLFTKHLHVSDDGSPWIH